MSAHPENGRRLSDEQRQRVCAMLHKGAGDRAIAAAVGCDQSSVYHYRDRLGLVGKRQPRGPQVTLCVRAGCDEKALTDTRTCAAHAEAVLPVVDSGFVRAPSRARLMAGR